MTYGYLTIEDAIDAAMYLEKSDIFQMVIMFYFILFISKISGCSFPANHLGSSVDCNDLGILLHSVRIF